MKNILPLLINTGLSPTEWIGKLEFGKKDGDLINLVVGIINSVVGIVALVAVVMLIWNGVQYITAGGDDGKVEKATKGITNSVIGLVIAFIAGLIVRFVIQTLESGNVAT